MTHMIQNSNICWILMTVDSVIADPEDVKWAKKIADVFYERCAVGYVDISFPSNFDLFRNFTADGRTGWLIGKYPRAELIHSNYTSNNWTLVLILCRTCRIIIFRYNLYNIEYWGKSVPPLLLKEFPVQVIKGLVAEFYDLMMEDDLKIEAIFSYDDPKKDVIKGKLMQSGHTDLKWFK